ncbi:glucosaminidase domain-containing protein [Daejeonella sp.]|uniref:glucosaminidase domain and LysM peptidoglycan-binding domain-containing protein n=1 Tax=Daejeonella sp. TaxID=2805397 RepID=UPI0039839805
MKHLCILLFICLSSTVKAQTSAREYIEKYKDLAISHMNDQGVPASVILAISMHESANGNSKLAKYLNNYFGIKGKNTSTDIKSSYRGYESAEDSYRDFMGAMHRNRKFKALFDKYSSYDYYNWVKGIENGGYAASKQWATRVLEIIKKYRLYELDARPEGAEVNPLNLASEPHKPAKSALSVYIVRKGDSLNAIAKKFSTSVKNLMIRNSLANSKLAIGQKLVL